METSNLAPHFFHCLSEEEVSGTLESLQCRGLSQSAAWLVELLPKGATKENSECAAPASRTDPLHPSEMRAKALFDLGFYERTAECLTDATSQLAIFLRCFSIYLVGEKYRYLAVAEITQTHNATPSIMFNALDDISPFPRPNANPMGNNFTQNSNDASINTSLPVPSVANTQTTPRRPVGGMATADTAGGMATADTAGGMVTAGTADGMVTVDTAERIGSNQLQNMESQEWSLDIIPKNSHLATVLFELQLAQKEFEQQGQAFDCFNWWLLGVALRGLGRTKEATEAFIASLKTCPLFWSAWCDLLPLLQGSLGDTLGLGPPMCLDAWLHLNTLPGIFHKLSPPLTKPPPLPTRPNNNNTFCDEATTTTATIAASSNVDANNSSSNINNSAKNDNKDVRNSEVLFSFGDVDSFESFSSVLGLVPHGGVAVGYIEWLLSTYRFAECFNLLSEIVELTSPHFSLYLLKRLARCSIGLQLWDEALAFYTIRAKIDAYDFEDCDQLAVVLRTKREIHQLSNLAVTCQKIQPTGSSSWCVIGHYYMSKGDTTAAIDSFERATKLRPSSHNAWRLYGESLEAAYNTTGNKEQINQAIKAYRRVEALNPNDYRAAYGMAKAYVALHDDQAAMFHFYRALKIYSGDASLWSALGDWLERNSEYFDALQCHHKAWRIDQNIFSLASIVRCVNKCEMEEGIVAWSEVLVDSFLFTPDPRTKGQDASLSTGQLPNSEKGDTSGDLCCMGTPQGSPLEKRSERENMRYEVQTPYVNMNTNTTTSSGKSAKRRTSNDSGQRDEVNKSILASVPPKDATGENNKSCKTILLPCEADLSRIVPKLVNDMTTGKWNDFATLTCKFVKFRDAGPVEVFEAAKCCLHHYAAIAGLLPPELQNNCIGIAPAKHTAQLNCNSDKYSNAAGKAKIYAHLVAGCGGEDKDNTYLRIAKRVLDEAF